MSPPLYSSPFRFRWRRITMPVTGLFLRSSLHRSQISLAFFGSMLDSILPKNSPFCS